MSSITINGLLILNGNLTSSGDITITPSGTVIPVPDPTLIKTYYSSESNSQIQSNGCGRTITSTTGNVIVQGNINGTGQGFTSEQGPGCNSLGKDSLGNKTQGYGATHAGIGADAPPAGVTVPPPKPPYGSYETPVSLGSGAGYYHDPMFFFGYNVIGGGAVKIVARSGIIQIDGTIDVSGQLGQFAGGSAGGSIWLWGYILQGSGSLLANGGSSLFGNGGGGGGGYISLWYDDRNSFAGTLAVNGGRPGGSDGKTYLKFVEPILEEKFTGDILNVKWWDATGLIALNNDAEFRSVPPGYVSELDSKFRISGENITVSFDSMVRGVESTFYSAYLRLYADSSNWISIVRKNERLFGISNENGAMDNFAIPFPYIDTTLRILKTDSTFFYQYWDSTSSAPQTIYTDVLPALEDKVFQVQLGLSQLEPQDEVRTEYYRMVNANLVNQTIYLDGTPSSVPAVNIIAGTSQYYGLDFYMYGDQIRWDSTGLNAFVSPFSFLVIDYFALTPTDILNKYVTLSYVPKNSLETAVNIVEGSSQYYGSDFVVVGDKVLWSGLGLDGELIAGDEIRVMFYFDPWAVNVPLVDLLQPGDEVRVTYSLPLSPTDSSSAFDNLKIYDGVISGAYSTKPVVYVDSSLGSDYSSGQQLYPLQNLFVATAWAPKGGIVVLYDGTYNPTEVVRKDLTIRGANGARPYISSSSVQDTTGSGWEQNALAFHHCQGFVENVQVGDGTTGILVTHSPDFEVRQCTLFNLANAIEIEECDPAVIRNTISDCTTGVVSVLSNNTYIYSNVIYDCNIGVELLDATNFTISSNTIDGNVVGVVSGTGSSGIIASNNLTDCSSGIYIAGDCSTSAYNDNYFGTPVWYNGILNNAVNEISVDPRYVNPGTGDYHLYDSSSGDINAGTGAFDQYFFDRDAVPRTDGTPAIGAYQFVDATHTGTDWYVAGTPAASDLNGGDASHPFRTLDRAMAIADSTIHIDGGHYDSYYLSLRSQNISLNELTIFTTQINHFVSYITLSAQDASNGYVTLPGFVTSPYDASFIALNVIGGPAMEYGYDFVVQGESLAWKGYALEPLLDAGDNLRILYEGVLAQKALNTLVLHSHYSNIDLGRMVFVSPSGSDSTVLGGDGTNTGGNGTWDRPYRTVQTALNNSSTGDHIILRAGEYPMFNGLNGRVLVPVIDQTSTPYKSHNWSSLEDFFAPKDFRNLGATQHDEVPWNFQYAGRSSVLSNGGYLSMIYDGSNIPSATSTFVMNGDWRIQAQLQNAIDPLFFSVYGGDNTVLFKFDNTHYTCFIHTTGEDYTSWGNVSSTPEVFENFIVEEFALTSTDIDNKYLPLSHVPDLSDCSSVALNVVGGVPQSYGDDFILQDARINWAGRGLDGELDPGDILRAIYVDRDVSGPLKVVISKRNGLIKVGVDDGTEKTIMYQNVPRDSSTWNVSFYMADPDTTIDHGCEGGRGFVSKFAAVADSFSSTSLNKPYGVKTERRTAIFYNHPDIQRTDNLSTFLDSTRTSFGVKSPPVVLGDNGGIVTSDPSKISVAVDGTAVSALTLNGGSGIFTLATAPLLDSTMTVTYYTSQLF